MGNNKRWLMEDQVKLKMQENLMTQEIYQRDPWKMMVCCIFLNQTNRKQLDKVRLKFFRSFPTAQEVIEADPAEIVEMIAPLGFKNRRTATIIKFSDEWLHTQWKEPIELHGIGKYGQDSWEIFRKGNLDVEPTDGVLKKYLKKIKNL
jgi:methyl-CpG-binding domain protein 4